MLIRVGLLNYVAGAILMPYAGYLGGGARAAPRHGGDRGPLRGLLRTGLSPPVHLAAARRARRAVLLCPRRPGRKRVEALLGRRLPVCRVTAARARAGSCTPPSRSRARSRCRSRSCRTATPSSASRGPSRGRGALGRAPPDACRGDGLQHGTCREVAYADGLDLERAKVGIGLSCRLCDRLGLPQPRLSAARAPAGARSADLERRRPIGSSRARADRNTKLRQDFRRGITSAPDDFFRQSVIHDRLWPSSFRHG